MQVILKDGFDYIPEWMGNRKEKKEDQIVVHFDFFSAENMTDSYRSDGTLDRLADWLTICKSVTNLTVNDEVLGPSEVFSKKGLLTLFLELKTAYSEEGEVTKKK